MKIRRKVSVAILGLMIVIGGFFYVYDKIYLETGKISDRKTIIIAKGDNALMVGEKLATAEIITGKYYLAFYLWKTDQLRRLVAGVYEFSPGLKIPEVARIITGGEVVSVRIPVTFPEGWTIKKMAERLDANGLSGEDFIALANNPTQELKEKYLFLKDIPKGGTLEGYLFPDTYYFAKDASAQDVVEKMLKNFDVKMTDGMLSEIAAQKKTLYDIVTMASIIEGEVATDEDRKIVSGLFWNRLRIGMTLGSDATLEYVLGGNKRQHSIAETRIDSPYNTYVHKGLPPGPVSNPGMSSISAALYPSETQYVYFLTDTETGKTIFSKTFEEHIANKAKYGL